MPKVDTEAPPPPRRRRRWPFALGMLAMLALAGPTLIANSPLLGSALARAVPAAVGRLTARGATLGWTGPTALTGVELRDPQGGVVFSAERVEVARSLLGLALGGDAPLGVRVERPVAYVELRGPNPTNLETLVQALRRAPQAEGPAAAPTAARRFSVTVIDGELRVVDVGTKERWLVSALSATAANTGATDALDALVMEASGRVAEVDERGAPVGGGDFRATIGGDDTQRRLTGRLAGAPVSLLAALARRGDPSVQGRGIASGEAEAAWRAAAPDEPTAPSVLRTLLARGVTTSGAAALAGLELSCAATGGETLRLASIGAPWRLAAEPARLRVDELQARSEIGAVRLAGALTPQELDRLLAGAGEAPADLRLTADLDLARLGAIAPNVLRLQEGVRIDSGRVRLDVRNKPQDGVARLVGEVRTESLAGVSGERAIAWNDPLRATFVARRGDGGAGLGWLVESLRCESAFLDAEATGDAAQLTGTARFDLDRLSQELRQFVDLGPLRLAGRGETNLEWRRGERAGEWRLNARGGLDEVFVGARDQPLAAEQRLEFTADLLATAGGFASADVALTSGDDQLTLRLDPADGAGRQPLSARVVGDLASWRRRLRVAAPDLPGDDTLRLAGRLEATATGSVGKTGGRLDDCSATVADFAAEAVTPRGAPPGVSVREPRVEIQGDLAWDAAANEFRSAAMQLVSSAMSLRARDVLALRDTPSAARGEFALRADLARIAEWFPAREGGAAYSAQGAVTGKGSLRGVPEGLAVRATLAGEGLTLLATDPRQAQGAAPVWSEPSLRADLDALVLSVAAGDGAKRLAVELRELKVASDTLSAQATGRVDDVARLGGVQLGGAVDYDLEKLSPLLWPRLGQDVRLVGKERATFRVASADGATGIAGLDARFEAPWQSADVFGLPVGPGKLAGSLARGVLTTDPLAVAIGQGRLTTQGRVTLAPPPQRLELAPGPVVSNVAISAEVTERVLKFIAPVLADATRTDGLFSLTLSEFGAPLGDLGNGRSTGTLEIHSAQVRPGPGIAEWVAFIRQVRGVVRDGVEGAAPSSERPLLTINQQRVEFQLAERRVFHRGLEFAVGDAVVRSEGSVGVDETLDLLLTIPIQEEWVARRPVLLGALKGQSLRVPVRGTLSRPEIDRQAFQQLSGQLLQSAAEGAIGSGLDLLFERLRQR